MLCPLCQRHARRNGTNRSGSDRYRCDACHHSFTDAQTQLVDRRRLPVERAAFCLRLLLEGSSVRSIERLLGINRNTIIHTMVEAGDRCRCYLDGLRSLPATDVQVDELWAFVRMKEKTRLRLGCGEECGDVWCFIAIERGTKLILAHHIGKRTPEDALLFAEQLRRATRPARFQLSTDGFTSYPEAIRSVFGLGIDYGTVVKVIGPTPEEGTAGRYSPGRVTAIHKDTVIGSPDRDRICTSHIERQNKTLRMQIRRYTRLTDGHSKKWENHAAAVALYLAYFNFCRIHSTIETAPAVAAGLAEQPWSVPDLLDRVSRPA